MERVYESGASQAAPTPPTNPSIGYPSRGNPSTGIMPTVPGPYMMHQLVEEIMAVIAAAGIAPDKANLSQLLTALRSTGVFQNPAQFDDSTKAATTAWVNHRGVAFSSINGRALNVSCSIDPTWLGSWGEVQNPNLTFTLPRASSVFLGSVFVFKCGFDCTIAAAPAVVGANPLPADLISPPTVGVASTFHGYSGETITLVSNGIAWYVIGIGHSIATSDARYAQIAGLFCHGTFNAAPAVNAWLQNTTGYPLFVSAVVSSALANAVAYSLNIQCSTLTGGTTTPVTLDSDWCINYNSAWADHAKVSAIIPAGQFFRINTSFALTPSAVY